LFVNGPYTIARDVNFAQPSGTYTSGALYIGGLTNDNATFSGNITMPKARACFVESFRRAMGTNALNFHWR